MLDAQKPNAEWMLAMIQKHRIAARKWAERAGLGKDTVSRAVKEDCTFVTKVGTLVKLADALGERPPGAASAIPSVSAIGDILTELAASLMPDYRLSADIIHSVAEAFRDTLLHLADEPESALDAQAARLLARASARRLGRLADG